jgi:hypothetical protein
LGGQARSPREAADLLGERINRAASKATGVAKISTETMPVVQAMAAATEEITGSSAEIGRQVDAAELDKEVSTVVADLSAAGRKAG